MEKRGIQLSERLKMIASFVSEGNRLADIGTDHGYVPIYLVKKNIIPFAIAMDINEGPLKKAEEHVRAENLEGLISLRLSDGLDALDEDEVDTILIAGMGGRLIEKILERGKELCMNVRELILSPHSEIGLIRKYLAESGFLIMKEKMVLDEEKYYTVIKAVRGKMQYDSEEELLYGKLLLEDRDPVLRGYLLNEQSKYQKILTKLPKNKEHVNGRREQIQHRIRVIEKALARY